MAEEQERGVTKIRIQIPRGMPIEDVLTSLQISFEQVDPTGAEIRPDLSCCVDATVLSPFSTVNAV